MTELEQDMDQYRISWQKDVDDMDAGKLPIEAKLVRLWIIQYGCDRKSRHRFKELYNADLLELVRSGLIGHNMDMDPSSDFEDFDEHDNSIPPSEWLVKEWIEEEGIGSESIRRFKKFYCGDLLKLAKKYGLLDPALLSDIPDYGTPPESSLVEEWIDEEGIDIHSVRRFKIFCGCDLLELAKKYGLLKSSNELRELLS